MGRPVPRQLWRNALLDVTTIVPTTAYHRRSYTKRYSRFNASRNNLASRRSPCGRCWLGRGRPAHRKRATLCGAGGAQLYGPAQRPARLYRPGRRPGYGERVRPLPRTHKGRPIAASLPATTAQWVVAGRTLQAQVWDNLVLSTAQPGAPVLRCAVIHDPRYQEPWVLATNLSVSAYALWCLYRDRWPVEQLPLAAKQMVGAHRAFVFGDESRHRRPELALLAGNVLAYAAATATAVATGFWDRCCRPTCGRLRRVLLRVDFSELPVPAGPLRKKASVTAHLPKGVQGHRRQTGVLTLLANSLRRRKAA